MPTPRFDSVPFAAADSVTVTVSVWPTFTSAMVTFENGAMVCQIGHRLAGDGAGDRRGHGHVGGDDGCRAVGGGAPPCRCPDGKAGGDGLPRRDLIDGRREHQAVQRRGDRGAVPVSV